MGIFSETLVIHHGKDRGKVKPEKKVKIRHSSMPDHGMQNGHVDRTSDNSDLYNESSFYEEHTVQKKFSLGSKLSQLNGNIDFKVETKQPLHKKGYSGDFISCFVRSEIKWVFLKNLKVMKGSYFIS